MDDSTFPFRRRPRWVLGSRYHFANRLRRSSQIERPSFHSEQGNAYRHKVGVDSGKTQRWIPGNPCWSPDGECSLGGAFLRSVLPPERLFPVRERLRGSIDLCEPQCTERDWRREIFG